MPDASLRRCAAFRCSQRNAEPLARVVLDLVPDSDKNSEKEGRVVFKVRRGVGRHVPRQGPCMAAALFTVAHARSL